MRELDTLKERIGEIHDIHTTQGLLGWDLETYMPQKGAEIRAKQMSTLSKLSHTMMTSDEMGNLLKTLRAPEVFDRLETIDRALVREVGKEFDRATKLPVSLVQELQETTAKAHTVWVEARKANDFGKFAPVLDKIVDLNRQMADLLGYDKANGSPYDALMDLYEPGLTTRQLDKLFANLKEELVPLVKAISESTDKPDTSFLHKHSPTDLQWKFSEEVIAAMGFDLDAGRLDKAPHPFCMGMGPLDVRLTTRLFEDDMVSSLFSSMHEAGHGMYEQGLNPKLMRTPLADGASLGIHESQSRMWENLVGRSRSFWEYHYPRLQQLFPEQLNGVSLEQFYRAINESKPSLIRVESDEATYNLHILLRYEIEKDVIEGRLNVADLPRVWNEKMQDYLGLVPPSDTQGVLQDIHWSHGSFGYFPTYTLGNMYSVQLYNTAKKEMPDMEAQIAKGNMKPLRDWLKKAVHYYGKVETPAEIILRVTGEPLNAQYFVDYLWGKFGPIYNIQRPERKTAAVH